MNEIASAAQTVKDQVLVAAMLDGAHLQEKATVEIRYNEFYQNLPLDALKAWRRQSQQLFGQQQASESLHKRERSELQEKLRQCIKEFAPDLYAKATTISEVLAKTKFDDIKHHNLSEPFNKAHVMDGPNIHGVVILPPPDGMFWWSKTEVFSSDAGLQAQFETDGLHLFGHINYGGDRLIQRNIGAIASFTLDPVRIPSSGNGRWRSSPWVELFGRLDGWTGFYDGLWAADDKWCKCRLFLRQTAFQVINSEPKVLASNTELRPLIIEENNSRAVHCDLPGIVPMPMLEMSLIDSKEKVHVDLEVRFDIELEGDSYIGFSPQANPFQSVLLRHFQWPIAAI